MKKVLILIITLYYTIAFSKAENGIEPEFNGKEYVVSKKEHLIWIAEQTNSGKNDFAGVSFKLYAASNSLEVSGSLTEPIGNQEYPFRGNFDGNGNVIHGLRFDTSLQYIGLFGYAENGVIKNVSILSYNGIRTNHPNGYAGMIAGYSNSAIINCKAQSTSGEWEPFLGYYCTGGIAGRSDGPIYNCYAEIAYAGKKGQTTKEVLYMGGIAGISNGIIENCISSITFSGSNTGYITALEMQNSSLQSNYRNESNNSGLGNDQNSINGGILNNNQINSILQSNISEYVYFHPLNNWNNLTLTLNVQEDAIIKPFTGGGSGLLQDPFLIKEYSNLVEIATIINQQNNNNLSYYTTAHYKVISDLDLSNSNWIPIGNSSTTPFKGHFDGNGKTISNLKMTASTDFAGLFGYTDGASIKNIILKDITIQGSNAGGIAGSLNNSVLSHNFVYGSNSFSGYKDKNNAGRIYGGTSGSIITENYGTGTEIGKDATFNGKDGLTLTELKSTSSIVLNNANNKDVNYYLYGDSESLSITKKKDDKTDITTVFCLNNTIPGKVTLGENIKQRGFLNSGSLELTASTEISPAGIKNTGEITLTRQPNIWADKNNNGAGWETLCLPFDANVFVYENKVEAITQNSKGKFWLREFIDNDSDPSSVTFASLKNAVSEGEYTIKKNTPYIISYPGNTYGASTLQEKTITYRGSGNIDELVINPQLTHTNSEYIFEGRNHSINGVNGYILNSADNIFVNTSNASVAPYQAYFLPKGTSASNVQVLRIATGTNQPTDLTDGRKEDKSIRTYVADGVVYLTSDRSQIVKIWNAASGMGVREIEVNNETVTISGLPKGIYIIDREKIAVY